MRNVRHKSFLLALSARVAREDLLSEEEQECQQ